MQAGTFRLTYCYTKGGRRYEYAVTPDTASWCAAAMIAREAMEEAIRKAAPASNHAKTIPYTKKQLAILARFREEMSAAGGLLPEWWEHTSPYELSKVAVEAVRNFKP